MVLREHEEDQGGGKEEEVDLPKGCSEGKWPWIVKPPPGAGRGDIKKMSNKGRGKSLRVKKRKNGKDKVEG